MKEASLELLKDLTFCVIDLETTGGNHEFDKIIEIGMVKIENLKAVSDKSFLLNPQIQIPEFIQKLTSIKQEDIAHSPLVENVIDEVVAFIGDSILVAHNTSFDIPFLNSVLRRLNRPVLTNKVLCTNVMTKYLIPEILSSNLSYMSQLFNIGHNKAHRAIEDAWATSRLLLHYLDLFGKKGIRKINQLYYPRNHFELDRLNLERHEINWENLTALLDKQTSALQITLKGPKGEIEAIFPYEGKEDQILLEDFFNTKEWTQISLKLMAPLTRILLSMSPHWAKIKEERRHKIFRHLQQKYPLSTSYEKVMMEEDFILDQHLISQQYTLINCLTLTPTSFLITKFPNHKKKMIQFMNGASNRFEQQHKSQKRWAIENDMAILIAGSIQNKKAKGHFLSISLKELKSVGAKECADKIETYCLGQTNSFNFPTQHL